MDAPQAITCRTFPSTHWTNVYLASDHSKEAGAQALAQILKVYRPALQRHLLEQFKGVSPDEIDDWISAFIQKKVLEQHLLRNIRKEKGKFRTYVLTALDRFARDQCRSQARLKRLPDGGLVTLEESHDCVADQLSSQSHTGDLNWAMQVIERARDRMEEFYVTKNRPDSWGVFLEGCYLPLYKGQTRPSDAELAIKFGFKSAREVSNTIINTKRKFGSLLREVVSEYVSTEEEVDSEIRELIAIVSNI